MIQSRIHNEGIGQSAQPRSLQLTQGQVFQGRIAKLYPQNMAALQVRGMTVTARLEAALTAGQRYWFEVQESAGIPRLRVLDDNAIRQREGLGDQPSVQKLIQQLSLPASKETEAFVRQLTEQQQPFTRQTVVAGSQLLNELQQFNQKGFQTLIEMIQRQLPLTKETFQAYQALTAGPSLTQQLQRLSQMLEQSNHSASAQLRQLTASLVHGDQQARPSPVVQLMSQFAAEGEGEAGRGAGQLLARLGIIQAGTDSSQLARQFQAAVLHPANREIAASLWPDIRSGQGSELSRMEPRQFLETMLARLTIPAGKAGEPALQQLLQLLQIKEPAANLNTRWLALPQQELSASERSAFLQVLESATPFAQEKGGPARHLQNLLQLLGYQHERDVSRLLQGELTRETVMTDRLKAQLLQLQQQDLPASLKEQVNQTLQRLTGQQLLAQEQNGPYQQLVLQLPLTLGAWQTDMTVQWEGKKQQNGELNPDYCRILFYLTLEQLEETIVDVQIQNRVVTVTVFNEKESPEALIHLLLPGLKTGLAEHNYQLLSVKWRKMKDAQASPQQANQVYKPHVHYQGVDVRI
ncbi:hypothetical protein M3212_01375 [Alkalihalobacillus oceani]|uniref:hypothetical protein n=1 Tax=Halalkalibacter oceani TaxID=1653776 RepID=UPI002041875A|nr:hypothetical protein [Halalkalibacter oceani]MCM3759430.1 hypothetical protein [Halalkalibacter oceani]